MTMMMRINQRLLTLLLAMQYLQIATLDGTHAANISKHYLSIRADLDIDPHSTSGNAVLQKRFIQDLVPTVTGAGPKMSSQSTKQMYDPPMAYDATGLANIRNSLKLNGRGVSIGIIDSGVDVTHPALGGCVNEARCRIRYAHGFVEDTFAPGGKEAVNASPLDCLGHGTKVAGIIGAKTSTFTGVAPEATLGVYKVAGCTQYMSAPIVISALKMAAISHKMDIINMSMGILYDANLVRTIDEIAKLNVIIVTAVGNNVNGNMWDENIPAILPSTISVGSANVEPVMSHWFTSKSPMSKQFAYSTACTNMAHQLGDVNIVLANVMYNGLHCKIADNLSGKVALFLVNRCPLDQLLKTAKQAGAIGAMVTSSFAESKPFACELPYFALSDALAEYTANIVKNDPAHMWNFAGQFGPMELWDQMGVNTKSSWGPTLKLTINPDIMAPGSHAFTTMKEGKYYVSRGTSMASPYTAGVIALYQQHYMGMNKRHPKNDAIGVAQVKAMLQNSAIPLKPINDPLYVSVARQGSGLLNVQRMFESRTRVEPPILELFDTDYRQKQFGGNPVYRFTIKNNSKENRVYQMSHLPSISVRGINQNGTPIIPPSRNTNTAIVEFIGKTEIAVAAGGHAIVNVKVHEPSELLPPQESWYYSGSIAFTPKTATNILLTQETVYIPYLGMKGSMAAIQHYFIPNAKPQQQQQQR
ncbi:peptidase S8/S53 domain-containing protein [Syncephalis plumigaleata]|nr:peptidase S8/S53 domain-containing protein [Syncephalis plumigaleata]